MDAAMEFVGCLTGHTNWVTSVTAPSDNPDIVVSGSRDKSVIVWNLSEGRGEQTVGYAKSRLTGHNEAVNDVAVSSDGSYVVSASSDKTLRLFDVNAGKSVRNFVDHTSDVFSVALSPDNRQIISGSRDHSIKVWNAMGVCMYTLDGGQHNDWVSCVRFSPSSDQPLFVSCGWDKVVKVWELPSFKLTCNLVGHSSVLNAVTIAPDGSLCASGGKDGVVMLWDVNEGKHLYSLDANYSINALCFCPSNYWLCAATDKFIRIWELEHKMPIAEFAPPAPIKNGTPWCVSLAWSNDGKTLFAGSTDSNIYVYKVKN